MFLKPLAALSVLALASCATIAPPAPKGTVDHFVLLWQKRPGNLEDRKALAEAANSLRVIPGIRTLDFGPALQSDRPVVDDSFDIGMLVRFDSAASLHAYETNPRHLEKVNKVLKPLTKKIVVYDVIH